MVERFILRRDGIDGDALLLECLYELDEILCIGAAQPGVEVSARP